MVANDDVIPLRWPVRSPDGKHVLHEIPVTKGQVIHIPSRTVNRLACVWGPDAEVFVPERWLDSDPARLPNPADLTNGWSGIFAFSGGPRACVGFRLGKFIYMRFHIILFFIVLIMFTLALLEMKIFIFTFIKHFVLEDLGETIVPVFSTTLQPLVKGKESQGVQLPVRISIYNA